jgi:phage shock protein PspC (stress-responsive transcriptional regulator)
MATTRGQLARSETDKRIAGVCGGIAEYFDIDPLLVRIGFVVAAFMGFGVIAYIALWIALPKGALGALSGARSPSAVRIAEERFARGEISSEELQQIRSDLMQGP